MNTEDPKPIDPALAQAATDRLRAAHVNLVVPSAHRPGALREITFGAPPLMEVSARPKQQANASAQQIIASSTKRSTAHWLERILTDDVIMQEQKRLTAVYAPRPEPVLITGPTGTGKELFARALHGDRVGRFVAVNCGGFPEQLVDSMLFGHRQGAFTGASSDAVGLFGAANNGTIFLDEIAELPVLMQVKLLRAIQEREYMRIGCTDVIATNARVVCATNRCLEDEVEAGRFREDLYWRVTTLVLRTTPLSERPADIVLYMRSVFGVDMPACIPEVKRGNYRELQQWITRHQLGCGAVH